MREIVNLAGGRFTWHVFAQAACLRKARVNAFLEVPRETALAAVAEGPLYSATLHSPIQCPTRYTEFVARIIAIANQKGGVGKTTTAVNLAASLAVAEQRTLLVDGDPQGNATSGLGIERGAIRRTTYDALLNLAPAAEAVLREVQFKALDLIPATPDLAGAEIELVDFEERDRAMRRALEPLRSSYDFILVDCPPSLGLLTVNMLAAADAVLIPLQCEYYALEGLSQLLNTIHLVQRSINEHLIVDGVILTMYDARLNLSRQVASEARDYFGDKVYDSVIPRNVRLAEAPSFGKPIILYDVSSVGAVAYIQLAKEVIARSGTLDPSQFVRDPVKT